MKSHYQILIIGGGNAGISAAAQLLQKRKNLDIAIIEPSDKHYYQPGLTLVGGGVMTLNQIIRSEADYIPQSAQWIKDSAETFEPTANQVTTISGQKFTYDYMIVCCGVQLNWDSIKGLSETLGKNGVCSNYSFELAPYTYECIKNFNGGKAVFTQPGSLIKCGAAPQKIMYLAADNFRKRGILEKAEIYFYTGKPGLLRVKEVNTALMQISRRYGINVVLQSNLLEVKGEAKEAVIEVINGKNMEKVTVKFEMLHVAPPMSAPDFIKNSPLAIQGDPQGWVDVDMNSFQHKRYSNIFSIGDAAGLGDTKTGAAVHKQVPLLVKNFLTVIDTNALSEITRYDGYTACPVTTAYGKILLAEFNHESKLTPTFPVNPIKERYSMWLLMRYGMPLLYWNRILRGKD